MGGFKIIDKYLIFPYLPFEKPGGWKKFLFLPFSLADVSTEKKMHNVRVVS